MSRWYPIAGLPQVSGPVRVRLFWSGWEGAADVTWNRVTKKHTFEEVRAGGMRLPLPPRNRKGKWTEQPQAFQPFDESWPHALPDPLASTPEAHFAPTVVDAPIEKHARHWWFDPMQIVYETAPKISRRMVEGRVMRAWRCILLTKLDARDRVVDTSNAAVIAKMIHMAKSSGEIMAELVADIESGRKTFRIDTFEKGPKDSDTEILLAGSWLAALDPTPDMRQQRDGLPFSIHQKVVMWRARDEPRSWPDIAFELSQGRDPVTREKKTYDKSDARRLYTEAIDRLHAIANAPGRWRQTQEPRQTGRGSDMRQGA